MGGEGGFVAAGRTGKSGVVTPGRSVEMGKSRYAGFSLSTETVSFAAVKVLRKVLGRLLQDFEGAIVW